MIPKVLSKVQKEKVPMMILVTPTWPSQLWYLEAMIMSIQQPILLTWRRDLSKNPQEEIHPLVQNKTLKLVAWTVEIHPLVQNKTLKLVAWAVLGLDYKRKEFQGRFSNLIIKSRRSSFNSNYESAWGKWAGCCAERKIDPFCSNINQILEFLSQHFQNGLQYRTINNYRSAISAFHDHIQGKSVGEHPRICSLVAGVFNSRPPQPRYCFIWNVQTVIDFIKSEWGQNEDLSDKYLTCKLTILLALTSASRVLGLQHLDIRFLTKGTINDMFTFEKIHKTWRKVKSPPSLKVYSFEEDTKLCVVATLEEYIKRTKVWRGKDKSQLLLSFVKPHNPVVSSAISGWIKNVLREAGIDTKIF